MIATTCIEDKFYNRYPNILVLRKLDFCILYAALCVLSNKTNNFQTPDSKKDKSLTPKTPKVPLSLEEIKAKMQASVDKVSF